MSNEPEKPHTEVAGPTTITLETPDGHKADITELLEDPGKLDRALAAIGGGNMAPTATAVGTDAAIATIETTIHERLQELMPDATRYAKASGAPASITIKVQLAPDKDIPDGWWVTVIPSLAAKGLIAEGRAKIEHAGNGTQLELVGGGLDPK